VFSEVLEAHPYSVAQTNVTKKEKQHTFLKNNLYFIYLIINKINIYASAFYNKI